MRILLVNHFPLEGSGSGTYTGNIAQYLSKNGHEVCVIFPENTIPEEVPGLLLYPVFFSGGTPISDALPYNFPCFTTHPRSNTTFSDLRKNELNQYLRAFDKVISETIHNFQPDIIHAQHIWCLSYLITNYTTPCVITSHGTDLMGYEKWPRFRLFADIAVNRCARIIAISRDNYQSLIEIFPQAENKTLTMSNGYNDSIFFIENIDRATLLAKYGIPYKREQVVLFAGKLTTLKGVDILLSAAKKYEKLKQNSIITVIAGNGEKEKELKQLKETLKLQNVFFIGHINQNELRQLYSNVDVFVMPSRYEAFGLVALEAMACGLPVVASKVGGLSDFVNSDVGTLVNSNDPEALCDAVIKEIHCMRNSAVRKQSIAKYTYAHYSQTHFIKKLESVYLDILNSSSNTTGQ